MLYLPGDDLGLNLRRNKDFAAVTAASFEPLGARTNYGAEAANKRAVAAVERILDRWDVMAPLLSGESYARLTRRLDTLSLVRS